MGTLPGINLKGLSRLIYKFEWDKGIQAYAHEPKDQRAADDIFNTQGRLYKTMRFSVHLGDEPCPKCEERRAQDEAEAEAEALAWKAEEKKPKKKKQTVVAA